MKKYTILFLIGVSIFLASCGNELPINEAKIEPKEGEELFILEAWADNWFSAYLGNDLIIEDSVSINTERSFNAERIKFAGNYPLHLNIIMKDFKENDTGLEYIGAKNQQMGDGGFIMQIKDSSGEVVAVTDNSWKCKVIHNAPINKSCESSDNPQEGVGECASQSMPKPEDWKSVGFDDSSWENATVHSAAAVGPKDGYDDIDWDSSADIIWGPDLETNNTIFCRATIEKK